MATPKKPTKKRKPKKPGPVGISEVRYEAALRKHGGVLALAAQELGVTRQAVKQRVDNSPKLQAAIADVEQTILDGAESVILTAIVVEKDNATARWYLERKGKSRGYASKSETEVRLPDDDLAAVVGAFGGDVEQLRQLRAAVGSPKAV